MHRRSRAEIVDFTEDDYNDNDDSKISHCKHCLEYGFKVPLKNRIYPDNEPIPVDHDQFRQCHECGTIVPIYELEKEASIKDVVETVENPFDQGKDFLGIDNRKSANKRKRQTDRQRELDSIKDEDLKRELAKGNTLISYTEHIPQ
ncbi:MAG TPA: hypothetical protein VF220_00370 [Nitrososphaeraceae archaeon]